MTKTGLAAALAGVLLLVACGGGGSDRVTNTTTTTTSSVATTTTVSSTTTTVPQAQFTTAMRVENGPCVAPSDAPVSCRWIASTTGGQAPFTYSWDFRTSSNNANAAGQTVSPILTCGVSSGTTSFDVDVTLTVRDSANVTAMATSRQQIAREKGACGTPP